MTPIIGHHAVSQLCLPKITVNSCPAVRTHGHPAQHQRGTGSGDPGSSAAFHLSTRHRQRPVRRHSHRVAQELEVVEQHRLGVLPGGCPNPVAAAPAHRHPGKRIRVEPRVRALKPHPIHRKFHHAVVERHIPAFDSNPIPVPWLLARSRRTEYDWRIYRASSIQRSAVEDDFRAVEVTAGCLVIATGTTDLGSRKNRE